jgi:hypothetical protein
MGLDDRSTDEDGQIRKTRNDKHVGTFEDEFGIDTGLRRDAHLKKANLEYGLPEDASQNALLRAIREAQK